MLLFSTMLFWTFLSLLVAPVLGSYLSFEDYTEKFHKSYATPEETRKRRDIYQRNVEVVLVHNAFTSSYKLGFNKFMDLEPHELPLGYDKSLHSSATTVKRRLASDGEDPLPFKVSPVHDLPASVDWRHASTPVKDQGGCGSCWAFASIACLESHLYLSSELLYSLSVQQLVSCAPNPKHCGGDGGCTGATSVQAYNLLAETGIVQEWSFGYQSYHGNNEVECAVEPKEPNKTVVKGTVGTIDGFVTLPPNNYAVLMNAVAKVGPIVISVAANSWGLYDGGVFTHEFKTATDADINHAVVLMGYGTDQETGQDYWLVRNSWSPTWGEQGYIRLFREDDAECTLDVTPGDGDACKFDKDGKPVGPLTPVKICGTSGVNYLGYFPTGVKAA